MKSLSFKRLSFVFIIGLAILLYGDVWGADWKLLAIDKGKGEQKFDN